MVSTRRPASYDQILALPEHLIGEIIDDVLYVSPRPASPHAFTSDALVFDLMEPFQRGRGGPGGWWLLTEPELHIERHVVVPDRAGWRQARMPTVPQVPYFDLAPDWVCEIASPSTAKLDRTKKTRVYAEAGVGHLWIIDPVARTLEVFRLVAKNWTLVAMHSDDEKVRVEPFEAVELDLAAWWIPGSSPASPAYPGGGTPPGRASEP